MPTDSEYPGTQNAEICVHTTGHTTGHSIELPTKTPCDSLDRSKAKLLTSSQTTLPTPKAIGFFSVTEIESIGFCGGYLVLNEIGRPVEFHCTLPVKPQKAQTILYGDALKPFLFAEHIGPPLIAKARVTAELVLVDQAESLGLEHHLPDQLNSIQNNRPRVALIQLADENRLGWKAGNPENAPIIDNWLGEISLDLSEPFERIKSAIEEAHAVNR